MPVEAVHLIWTTYGTWLPGDVRGHWSPLFDLYGRLRAQGHRLNLPDETTEQTSLHRLSHSPTILSSSDVAVVAQTIGSLVASPQRLGASRIHAAAIESNHTHLLVGGLTDTVSRIVGRLKGQTSSSVAAANGDGSSRTWTTGYWKVYLFDEHAIAAVASYIEQHNIRRGLPARPYHWIAPFH
jgi:REP element-mobilizing transposase RayT